jgi:hypothetical protein
MISILLALIAGGISVGVEIIAMHEFSRFREQPNDIAAAEGAGWMSFVGLCSNVCVSFPLAFTGIYMGATALILHRDRRHVLTWIGLVGNVLAMVAVAGWFAAVWFSKH